MTSRGARGHSDVIGIMTKRIIALASRAKLVDSTLNVTVRGGADEHEIGRTIDAMHVTVETWGP